MSSPLHDAILDAAVKLLQTAPDGVGIELRVSPGEPLVTVAGDLIGHGPREADVWLRASAIRDGVEHQRDVYGRLVRPGARWQIHWDHADDRLTQPWTCL